jgi:N-acetylglucosaminyldiphosphoundecaprenol N-acetyl-beta-D-mannosaminyltransferase
VGASVDVLGVEFYPITLNGACQALDWMLSRDDGRTRVAVTGNPIMVVDARRDPEFMDILRDADLLVPDGVGIIWAARKAGRDLPEKVTGVDLTRHLLQKKPSPGIFLLGGKPGVAGRARERLANEMPWVRIAGTHHGYFKDSEEAGVVLEVKSSRASVVLAGMGSPRQEKFLWRNRERLGARLGIGVGGVLDVLAGDRELAPESVRKAGFEWLYRLVREPGRLRADLKLLEFAFRVEAGSRSARKIQEEGERDDDSVELLEGRR